MAFSEDASEILSVPGETISLWLAIGLMLVGVISSVIVSLQLTPTDLQAKVFENLLGTGHYSVSPQKEKNSPKQSANVFPDPGEVHQQTLDMRSPSNISTVVNNKKIVSDIPHFEPAQSETRKGQQRQTELRTNEISEMMPVDQHNAEPMQKDIRNIQQRAENKAELKPKVISRSSVKKEKIQNDVHKNDDSVRAASAVSDEADIATAGKAICPPLFSFYFRRAGFIPITHQLTVEINRLKQWLRTHPDAKVLIEGHTDVYGTKEFNLQLSYSRTNTAAAVLKQAGIPGEKIISKAFGKQKLLPQELPGSMKNRRAAIRIVGHQQCINDLIDGNSG